MARLCDDLAFMVANAGGPDAGVLFDLVAAAQLNRPATIDAPAATAAVAPYSWFINRIGEDGLPLTSAGRLPPALVEEIVAALDLNPYGYGKANRELHSPVVYLRESTQRLGLARRLKGRLILTPAGRRLVDDPVGLWWHLADALPDGRHQLVRHAGIVVLLAVAAGGPIQSWNDLDLIIAGVLDALGWTDSKTGEPMPPRLAFEAGWDTWDVLHRIGAIPERDMARWPEPPAPPDESARAFARAALTMR